MKIMEFETDDGQGLLVEVRDEDLDDGYVPAGTKSEAGPIAKIKANIREIIDELVSGINDIFNAIEKQLDSNSDTVNLEFGIKLSAKVGAVIASGTTDAHIKISVQRKLVD